MDPLRVAKIGSTASVRSRHRLVILAGHLEPAREKIVRPHLRTASAVTCLSVTAGLMLTGAPTASAAARYITLKNKATHQCLDSNAAGKVYTKKCNGGSYQKWRVTQENETGFLIFKNKKTGRCLAGNKKAQVYGTKTCYPGDAPNRWEIVYIASGKQYSFSCHDVTSAKKDLYSPSTGKVSLGTGFNGNRETWIGTLQLHH